MKILIAFALVAAAAAVAVPKPVQLAGAPEPELVEVPAVIADASQKDLENNIADAAIDTVIVEHVQFVDHAEGFGNDFVHPFAYAGFDDAIETNNIEDDAFVHPLAYGGFEELGAEPSNFDDSYVHPLAYGAFDKVAQKEELAEEDEMKAAPVNIADIPSQNAADAANEEFAEENAEAAPIPVNLAAIQDIPSETDNDEVAPSAVNFVELVEDSGNEISPSAINFVEMPAPISLGEMPAPENFEEPESA